MRQRRSFAHIEAFAWAFFSTLLGPAVPLLRTELSLTYAQAGTLFSSSSIGFLVGALVAGPSLIRLGGPKTALLGAAALAVLGGSLAWATTYPLLLVAIFATGVAGGVATTHANHDVAELFPQRRSAALSLLNVSFGIGGLVAPLYAAVLIDFGGGRQEIYQWALPALCVVVFFAVWILWQNRRLPSFAEVREEPDQSPGGHIDSVAFTITAVAILLAAAVEWGFAYWSVSYFADVTGASAATAALLGSAFWVGMLVGRIALGRVLSRTQPRIVLRYTTVATLLVSLGIAVSRSTEWSAVLAALLGASLAAVIPTLMGQAIDRWPGANSRITSLSMFASGVGSFAAPAAIGGYADLTSLAASMWLLPIIAVLLILAQMVLMHRLRANASGLSG